MDHIYRVLFFVFLAVMSSKPSGLFGEEKKYDPLIVLADVEIKPVDLLLIDNDRKRGIPLRIYMQEKQLPSPVILFSHGLGGSRETNAFLGQHWAKRGFIVIHLQHLGSDSSVWRNKKALQAIKDMHKAANAENLFLRIQDVKAVLDQMEKWNVEKGHFFQAKLQLDKIGMSGHSFGAITTQAVSGQDMGLAVSSNDKRIKAAIIMSPSVPKYISAKKAFGQVSIPWLLMTGTKDTSPIGRIDVKSRLEVFPALPKIGKFEIVLYKAEHSVFSDKGSSRDKEVRNPNHKKIILALSTAFWESYLMDVAEAKNWLSGEEPLALFESKDRWQKK